MKFTSQRPSIHGGDVISVESSPEHNWDLNFHRALEAERKKFKRTIPLGIWVGEDGRTLRVGWKNNCFQVHATQVPCGGRCGKIVPARAPRCDECLANYSCPVHGELV